MRRDCPGSVPAGPRVGPKRREVLALTVAIAFVLPQATMSRVWASDIRRKTMLCIPKTPSARPERRMAVRAVRIGPACQADPRGGRLQIGGPWGARERAVARVRWTAITRRDGGPRQADESAGARHFGPALVDLRAPVDGRPAARCTPPPGTLQGRPWGIPGFRAPGPPHA